MENSRWKIDKHIPVAVILTIVLQTACVIWFASKLDSRISSLEQFRSETAIEMRTQEMRIRSNEINIPAIKEKMNNIEDGIRRIEKKLDKVSFNQNSSNEISSNLFAMSLEELTNIEVAKA